MAFTQADEIRYFTFDLFPKSVTHGVFTRHGGVSPAPWDSLNVGGSVGDDPARVRENRLRSFAALGRTCESIFDVHQVHSVNVVFADAPRSSETPYQQADIILTDRPGITLFMRFADCVPVLLHDPRKNVIGVAHAGWIGTVRSAVSAAVEAMCSHYGSRAEDILAAIGPSIGPDHYVVGPDVVVQVMQAFGKDAENLLASGDGMRFDLWAANRLLLERAGVRQIALAGLCTVCHTKDWYSHRAQHGRAGRFGVLAALAG